MAFVISPVMYQRLVANSRLAHPHLGRASKGIVKMLLVLPTE
jgi:hypothetical protein